MNNRQNLRNGFCILLCLLAAFAQAAILPEDRTDVLYHSYDGGDVTIQGPAVLLRKEFAGDYSATAHFLIDNISSASIDVQSYASPYEEKRTELGASIDYLYRDTILTASFINSTETDYDSNTFTLNMSHEMFFGLTTLNLGFTRGADVVTKSTDPLFSDEVDRVSYHFGVSQVVTKKLLMSFDVESKSYVGFLNNPYRVVRINGEFIHPERYPRTRSGVALATRAIYYLGKERSMMWGYRYYTDNWDIGAHTIDARFSHYYSSDWLAEYSIRYYTQTAASFYSDNFDQEYDFMARDKEMSTFNSASIGYKITYKIFESSDSFFDQGDIGLSYDLFQFNYKDFTHFQTGDAYSFRANVLRFLFTARY